MSSSEPARGRAERDRLAQADRFVARIVAVCRRDTGAGQAIRSAVGRTPAEAVRAHRYVARHIREMPAQAEEWAHYSVAGLVALYDPRAKPAKDHLVTDGQSVEEAAALTWGERLYGRNLGGVLAALDAPGVRGEDDPEGPSARRLQSLAREDLTGLHTTLPGLLRRVASGRLLPDWAVLLHDLSGWDRDQARDAAALRWSTAYYTHLARTVRTGSEK
ncbi:hypothetical protein GCM10020367_70280 [Streptomyces sannanensis]|uniref:Type I-E CRISPR-associated protein Cse2/CasB n=1 Tax=Streptomyces sannanensis TaxID=285536 RepID=A0ABP6SNM7_9ACTN